MTSARSVAPGIGWPSLTGVPETTPIGWVTQAATTTAPAALASTAREAGQGAEPSSSAAPPATEPDDVEQPVDNVNDSDVEPATTEVFARGSEMRGSEAEVASALPAHSTLPRPVNPRVITVSNQKGASARRRRPSTSRPLWRRRGYVSCSSTPIPRAMPVQL